MANSKKKIAIILCSILFVVAIATALVFIVVKEDKKAKTAETVMAFSVNPEVQIVLNKKDKVIAVKAINEDGDKLLATGKFIGLKAEDAAKLFVELSTKAGYIDVDSSSGTKVTIELIGSKEDYSEMKTEIVEAVNGYFDENGIIAGAVAEVKEDLKAMLEDINADVTNVSEKTKEELLALYADHAKRTQDVAFKHQAALSESYKTLKESYDKATEINSITLAGLKAAVEAFKVSIQSYSSELAEDLKPVFDIIGAENYEELEIALNKAQKSIEDLELSSTVKESFNKIISSAQTILNNMKESYLTAKETFDESYRKAILNALEKSEIYYEELKTEINNKIADFEKELNDRKAYYEANKQDVDKAIADYRARLAGII